jgi:hypothetical protein
MIADKCFTYDWVANVRRMMPQTSETTIEKSIRALALLERLAVSNLRFVFKGGTCMMLHLQELRRLSVDIDIVCTEGMSRISPVLETISRQLPFTRWDEHKRNPDRRPTRKHFRFFYDSFVANNPEPFVLLDVVLEHVPHPQVERKSVKSPFVETVAPPEVTVPTLDGLLGDKLTAFAPGTVGIKYRSNLSQQIVKQMFDVGELFLVGTDLGHIRQGYEASFGAENGFRKKRYRINQALDDSSEAAFRVSQLDLVGEEFWNDGKRKMLLDGIAAINVTLCRETYTVDEARLSASRAALLAALLRAGRSGPLAFYRYVPERVHELPVTLDGRYDVLNPLREIATEAFHNWHQVAMLDL